MELLILNCADRYFAAYLIKMIQEQVDLRTNKLKLLQIDLYLREALSNNNISSFQILQAAARALKIRIRDSQIIIAVDKNQPYQNTEIKLYQLLCLINYGNLEVAGYDVFTQSLQYVADNIDSIYRLYKG